MERTASDLRAPKLSVIGTSEAEIDGNGRIISGKRYAAAS
jgi:hypothetical protein